jgi:hypothetical protein
MPPTSCGHCCPQLCHNWFFQTIQSEAVGLLCDNLHMSNILRGFATILPQWQCVCLDYGVIIRPMRPFRVIVWVKSMYQKQEAIKHLKIHANASFFLDIWEIICSS